MKILFFIESLQSGGKERRIIELLKGLQEYPEIQCEIILSHNYIHYDEIFSLNVKIHYLIKKNKYDVLMFLKVFTLIKKIKPDIIHSWGHLQTIYSIIPAKLLRIKLINGMITTAPQQLPFLSKIWFYSKITFPFSDILVSNSNEGLISHKTPQSKRECIYNGFNFNRLNNLKSDEEIKKELNISTKYTVGMVGAFAERKDYNTFFEIAFEILQNRDDISFVAVGDGPNFQTMKKKVPTELKDKLILTGNRNDVESIVKIFDIAVLLTTQNILFGEGISNSIMEYMALKKVVIASDNGGNKEIIVDKITGFLVKNKKRNIIDIIIDLLDNRSKRIKMGAEGFKVINDKFSIESMIKKHILMYKKILKD